MNKSINRSKRRLVALLIGFLLFLLGLLALAVLVIWLRIPAARLPEDGQIKTIEALIQFSDDETVRFLVPTDHNSIITQSLQPSERDLHPAKWQGIGTLIVTLRNDKVILIDLYVLPQDPGAFSITTAWEKVYFRGGSSKGLESALRRAYKDSQEQAQ